MRYVSGNLFDHAKSGCIIHQANCKGVMNSGFAKEFRQRFPEAFEQYRKDIKSGMPLGDVSVHITSDYVLCSLLGQKEYGYAGAKYTSYDAIDNGLRYIFYQYIDEPMHMPAIGSGLGGGSWSVIEQIILSAAREMGYDHEKITIYELQK